MELGIPGSAGGHRYKKIVADSERLDALLVDLFLDMHPQPPEEIVLDLDATDDQVHGNQEGAQFHGYYGHYCFLPLYILCGDHLLGVRLRPSKIDASESALEELERLVGRIRERRGAPGGPLNIARREGVPDNESAGRTLRTPCPPVTFCPRRGKMDQVKPRPLSAWSITESPQIPIWATATGGAG